MVLYDKLKDIKTEEDFFDFNCPNCKVNGMKKGIFDIKPIGISYKPELVNNNDIKNNYLRKCYASLPTLKQAIFLAVGRNNCSKNLSFYCNTCEKHINVYKKVKTTEIRKWINRNLFDGLDLRIDK